MHRSRAATASSPAGNFENQFYLEGHRGLFFMIETVLLDETGVHLLSKDLSYGLETAGPHGG